MVNYRELRCSHCHKLLAKGSGSVQIKCSRCKTINTFSK
ncbi:TPA: Com family DNA-binding transcriptional regulator [Neisseria subflava]|nr:MULTISPECIES: Com family DNA-binding transcriptional regulator [unclassified Neisseria]UOO77302.1 Com family DNA-binding transcriptional regulator [Neisseria sp. Dent CA1/247]